MTKLFYLAVQAVLRSEGVLSDDAADRGGFTKYGISKRSYPTLDIAALTEDDAIQLYHRDYWTAAGCELLPPALAVVLFDGVVNHGVRTASKMLQRAVGAKEDGEVGPRTAEAAVAAGCPALDRYMAARGRLYFNLARNDPRQERFIDGWLARLIRTTREAIKIHQEVTQ